MRDKSLHVCSEHGFLVGTLLLVTSLNSAFDACLLTTSLLYVDPRLPIYLDSDETAQVLWFA